MTRLPRILLTTALMLCLGLGSGAAWAHDLWITCQNAHPNKPLNLELGYGHAFPQSQAVDASLVVTPYVVGPQGKVETKSTGERRFVTTKPLTPGTYLVLSGRGAQWYTKSPTGTQHKPKDQVPEALRCVRSVKFAKAVVNLGGARGEVSQPVGQTLEVVPLVNPAGLKVGQDLPVLVLFEGKPLPKALVLATFAGFSGRKNTFAFAAKTDKQGKALVRLWHPGQWLVTAKHKTPFADKAKCDHHLYAASLTFELK